jgi:hypothetical protein
MKAVSVKREGDSQQSPPLLVKDCVLITIATGIRAQNLRELRDKLETVHPNSIYYHFWGRLLSPSFEQPEFNNDFAAWARHGLHDYVLAERLAVVDPTDFPDLELLRQELIEVIEERLYESTMVPWAKTDQQFYFKRSKIVVFDTKQRIAEPRMLPQVLPTLSLGSIFYHFIDARRRPPEGIDDFSAWLDAFGETYVGLRNEIGSIDLYFSTMSEIRAQLAHLCTTHLTERGKLHA